MTRSEARGRANSICRYLSHYAPEQVILSDDGDMMAIVFAIIPDGDLPWLKAVELASDIATPHAFETLLTGWKMGVLGDIAEGKPSPVVRAAIEKFGYPRVMAALKPPKVH